MSGGRASAWVVVVPENERRSVAFGGAAARTYDAAGRPAGDFPLHVYDGGQHLRHPQVLPGLPLSRP